MQPILHIPFPPSSHPFFSTSGNHVWQVLMKTFLSELQLVLTAVRLSRCTEHKYQNKTNIFPSLFLKPPVAPGIPLPHLLLK